MLYISISILAFCLTLIVHIAIYRLFKKINADAPIAFLTFALGFIITVLIIFVFYWQFDAEMIMADGWFQPLPMTAAAIYLQMAIAYLIFLLAPFLGEESPTSTILIMLKKRKRSTYEEIRSIFTDQNLLGLRLIKCIDQRLICKRNDRYFILQRGRLVAVIFNFYRKILGWHKFG